jgi:hypothetical protein
MLGALPIHLTINNTSAWTVAIGAAAALGGALIGTGGLLLVEHLRSRRATAAGHITAMTEFLASANAWATFAAGYSPSAKSWNPLTIAAHNIDSRLTQNTTLLRAYQLNDRLWTSASRAIASATPDEYSVIRQVLLEAGAVTAGEATPISYFDAAAHLTAAIRAAQATYNRSWLHRLLRRPPVTAIRQAEIDGVLSPATEAHA